MHVPNLKQEIKIHQSLKHPNIVRFVDCLQEQNMVYMLLEYVENGALFFYINPVTGMSEEHAFRFFYQTALALEYVHSKGIMHRDVKPENILIDKNYNVKLCDFGWCAQYNDEEIKYDYLLFQKEHLWNIRVHAPRDCYATTT